MKTFDQLTESEILALAIANEEEDGRIYADLARRLRDTYPGTGAMLARMSEEEDGHRRALLAMHGRKFGSELPYVTRRDVRGFPTRRALWLIDDLRVGAARRFAAELERDAADFYARAAERSRDVEIRELLGTLEAAERGHVDSALSLEAEIDAEPEDAEAKRSFVLRVVQPGLAGLIDGSVSTLAPLFAAAFATHDPRQTFLVGLAAAVGAGISMGLTEGMSDDGAITGRGSPWLRGVVCGGMTAIGGLAHALPYLIPDFQIATAIAILVVVIELLVISWIRWRYMDTPMASAFAQVVAGGAIVTATGVLIGSG